MDSFSRILYFSSLLVCMTLSANETADTALFDAINTSDLEGVKEAFRNGASTDAKDKNQWNPFAKALFRYGMSKVGKKINKNKVDANKAVVYEIYNHMETVNPDDFITAASLGGLSDLVEKMINDGMSVDVRGTLGRTALMTLVHGYPDLDDVKFLVAKGADVNAIDKRKSVLAGGKTIESNVLDYALSPGTSEALRAAIYLIDKGARVTPQHFVRAAGNHNFNLELVKKIDAKIRNVDAVDNSGLTALRKAIEFGGSSEGINYLLDKKANVNAMVQGDPDSILFTAIFQYYYYNNIGLTIIEKILKNGAQVDDMAMALAQGDFPKLINLLGAEEGAVYVNYKQPDPVKKEQVLKLLQKYSQQ
ncbi:MAG: ankyrin repeat domain-containing protein [Candidatus Babeliales bacterium]